MSEMLYVYNSNNLKLLKEALKEYKFISIGHLLHEYKLIEDLSSLDSGSLNKAVLDISNIVKDGNFFRVFTEGYLRTLIEGFEGIRFCLQSKYFELFEEMFPYFFNEEEINYDFKSIDDTLKLTSTKFEIPSPKELYVYEEVSTIKKLYGTGASISLSCLVREHVGLGFTYNIDTITHTIRENKIKFVDISSAIKTLKLRKDLIFQFEMLIHDISSVNQISYCLESSLISEIDKLLPLVFCHEHSLDEHENIEALATLQPEIKQFDYSGTSLLVSQIEDKLHGHADFKTDFRHSLLKFSFLNNTGDRKILSILLCGESGIGKTEFAKIASKVIFPGESLIKINFGNYSSDGVLNSLIGSPLGYIGSEDGGELTNKINMSKSKIILIDEFEKATPSVYNFFYELLEDGKFTDRHGLEHDLNGYMIVFTSNMTQKQYQEHIPSSLKSRFDMVYYFIDVPIDDKYTYINLTANELIETINKNFNMLIDIETIRPQLNELVQMKNLRGIKRKIEDVIFAELFKRIEAQNLI